MEQYCKVSVRITKAFGAGLVTTAALLLTCHRVTLLYNNIAISKSGYDQESTDEVLVVDKVINYLFYKQDETLTMFYMFLNFNTAGIFVIFFGCLM